MIIPRVEPKPMADLHSHLLPGVDDGSKSPEQSLRVLKRMGGEGITAICLTPHLSLSELTPEHLAVKLQKHAAAYESLAKVAPELPACYRGFELMVNDTLPENVCLDRRVTLAGSRYLLVEFPPEFNAETITRLVRRITDRGVVPLIAHPERYSAGSIEGVFRWREQGAAVQVDATTLAIGKGERGRRARAILEAGLADILAADNHGDSRSLRRVFDYLCGVGAAEHADYLLRINPFAILRDQALEPVPRLETKRGWRTVLSGLFRRGLPPA